MKTKDLKGIHPIMKMVVETPLKDFDGQEIEEQFRRDKKNPVLWREPHKYVLRSGIGKTIHWFVVKAGDDTRVARYVLGWLNLDLTSCWVKAPEDFDLRLVEVAAEVQSVTSQEVQQTAAGDAAVEWDKLLDEHQGVEKKRDYAEELV